MFLGAVPFQILSRMTLTPHPPEYGLVRLRQSARLVGACLC